MTEAVKPGWDSLDQGFRFASELHEVVHEFGPSTLSSKEKEALGKYLLDSAVEWVRARNRAAKGPRHQ